jgi:acetylornithine deacetylase
VATAPHAAAERLSAFQFIERLVSFDTTSAKSNLALIESVAAYLSNHGVPFRLTHDDARAKANLYATVGPKVPGGVVLSGHTDVVPVEGQAWDSDPFGVVERGGKLYGRGTADMKSFIATALSLVPEMTKRRLKMPIHLALSYDEEVGCIGVGRLIDELGTALPRPALVIVGEPTMMKVANAHKGVIAFETRVVGREAHSSATHRGASAIMAAAEIVQFLAGLAAELAARPPRPGSRDAEFEPPYTTISVGTIEGGTALNIIPKSCRFRWDCRVLPGTDDGDDVLRKVNSFAAERVAPGLRAMSPDGGVVTEMLVTVPPLAPEEGSPAEALALALTGENRAGAVAYGSEAGLFQEAGIPAILCGPGDIAQAHQPNEFIARAQVDACDAFLRCVIDHCAA